MTIADILLLLTPAVPLVAALLAPLLRRPLWLLPLTPLPGLAAAWLVPAGTSVELPVVLLGSVLRLDATGAVFLGLCAFLWTAAGGYAIGYLAGKPRERSFCVFWQLTLAGSLGTCVADDVVTFYVCFSFLSLAAYGLVIHDRSDTSLGAGRVYIALAIFGETALLLGLLLLAHAAGSIRIEDVREALPEARWRDAAVLGLLGGLGLKAGLLPLHAWLPLAHSAAPVPASAVLSGAIVKAGVLGLLRMLPLDGSLADWGVVLTWLGLATAYAGVLLGLPQRLPKAVLAYSTMSQMGLLVALIGAGVAGASHVTEAATLHALHHGLAKGALFLSVGLLAVGSPGARRVVLIVAALLGASMAGLPLTGGALAKLAAKTPLGEGLAGTAAGLAAIGTMLLMLRFLVLVQRESAGKTAAAAADARMVLPFAGVALAAAIVGPAMAAALTGYGISQAMRPGALWSATWPLVLALGLAWVAMRVRWSVPQVPVGDIAAWAARAPARGG